MFMFWSQNLNGKLSEIKEVWERGKFFEDGNEYKKKHVAGFNNGYIM